MSESEGISVEDQSSDVLSVSSGLGQVGEVVSETGTSVLHEDDLILYPDDLVEAQIAEEFSGVALGVHEQVINAAIMFVLDEVSNDFVHEAFALMEMADGHAAECVAETASGSDDVIVFIIGGASVV